jgi:sterol desaturase/sphingolipid hydroxylase (fatty acid hydroxylase superfamily)
METITTYFSDMPTLHRTLLLVGGLTFFFLIEQAVPLFEIAYNRKRHTLQNVFFTLTTIVVNFALAFILVGAASWVYKAEFGVLHWLDLPLWAALIVGLLVMDFISSWLVHWVEHHVPWMWQFHLIHHTDQHVDTTTANRHHPGESIIRVAFTTLGVVIAGAPIWLIFVYQSASVVMTQWNHSNMKMPTAVDRALSWVLCTPNMHRVHHHYRQPYSDMNYGNIFSIWDRLFGTYIEVDNAKLRYGVDTHMEPQEAGRIASLLRIPFKKYRGHIKYEREEVL